MNGSLDGASVAIWGLAFKSGTDDMRDAPSVTIIRGLQNRGAKVRAYDPLAMKACKDIMPDVVYCDTPYEAAEGAEVIAILTSWNEFTYIDFQRLKEVSRCRTIVDGRNVYNPDRMGTLGYRYVSVGRVPFEPGMTSAPVPESPNVKV